SRAHIRQVVVGGGETQNHVGAGGYYPTGVTSWHGGCGATIGVRISRPGHTRYLRTDCNAGFARSRAVRPLEYRISPRPRRHTPSTSAGTGSWAAGSGRSRACRSAAWQAQRFSLSSLALGSLRGNGARPAGRDRLAGGGRTAGLPGGHGPEGALGEDAHQRLLRRLEIRHLVDGAAAD